MQTPKRGGTLQWFILWKKFGGNLDVHKTNNKMFFSLSRVLKNKRKSSSYAWT